MAPTLVSPDPGHTPFLIRDVSVARHAGRSEPTVASAHGGG